MSKWLRVKDNDLLVRRNLDIAGTLAVINADKLTVGGNIAPPFGYARFFTPAGAVAGDYDARFFIADRGYQVTAVREHHQTAGSSTTASVDVLKVTNAQARASGVSVLAAVIDLSQAANTVQSPALNATVGNLQMVAGDSLAVNPAGTLTAVDGVAVQVTMKPI